MPAPASALRLPSPSCSCRGDRTSAHAFIGKNMAGLTDADIAANRNGTSTDDRAAAAVKFAVRVVETRGHVSDADVAAIRLAGYSDAEVVEIVLHVALNTLTNYVNEVAEHDDRLPGRQGARRGMTVERKYPSDIAFTPTVKGIQQRRGSRASYERMEAGRGSSTTITPCSTSPTSSRRRRACSSALRARTGSRTSSIAVARRDSCAAPTSGRSLSPTIAATGSTLQGNLADNPQAFLFLIDYAHRRRIKIWGEARVVEDDPHLVQSLMPEGYKAWPEQALT